MSEKWQEKFPFCYLILLKTTMICGGVNTINDAKAGKQQKFSKSWTIDIYFMKFIRTFGGRGFFLKLKLSVSSFSSPSNLTC